MFTTAAQGHRKHAAPTPVGAGAVSRDARPTSAGAHRTGVPVVTGMIGKTADDGAVQPLLESMSHVTASAAASVVKQTYSHAQPLGYPQSHSSHSHALPHIYTGAGGAGGLAGYRSTGALAAAASVAAATAAMVSGGGDSDAAEHNTVPPRRPLSGKKGLF